MKNKIEVKKQLGKFRELEVEILNSIAKELINIAENPQITESHLQQLENIVRQLMTMKESHTQRLIKILKQNHMVD